MTKGHKRRVSITKLQRRTTAAVDLIALCQTITDDGELADVEIAALQEWLRDNERVDLPAKDFLSQVVEKILADGHVTAEERDELYAAIEMVLPPDIRADVRGKRREAGARWPRRRPSDARWRTMSVTPHHVGCAVERLAESYASYAGTFGLKRRTRPFDVASQHVRVCFIELSDGFYLELISALDASAKISSFLRTGFYHLGFLVDDLELAHAHLHDRKFFPLPPFPSEAFAGARCQFFLSPQRHLIEITQMSRSAFTEFFRASVVNEA